MNAYLLEVIFLFVLILFAYIQRQIVLVDLKRKRSGGIKHFFWAFLYLGCMALAYWGNNSPILQICLVLLRVVFFNPFFNYLNNNPFFHLGDKSIVDRIIKKFYWQLYVACCILFITLQFFLWQQ